MEIFDKVWDRRGTSCLKYDFAAERGRPEDVLPFWVADMDFQTPAPVMDELVRRSRHGIFGYTDVKEDYRETLRKWFRKRHDWTPDVHKMAITPGVVFAICTAIRAFTREEDAVLICPPVYYPFSTSIRANRRHLVESPLCWKDGRYTVDFEDFEKKIREERVKLFLLCSPHNPVGRVWTEEELERIGEICLRYRVTVVADEIHADFIRPGIHHKVFATLSPEVEALTITCTSPSKTFNLAGLQISNVFISQEERLEKFLRELEAAGYSQPNALGIFAAKAAYDGGEAWLEELLSYLEENIRRTKEFLLKELPKVRLVEPEGTYLLWLDFSAYGLGDRELEEIIVHRGKLWLDSGYIFGPGGEGFQRLNIACPWSVLEKGLSRLADAFRP